MDIVKKIQEYNEAFDFYMDRGEMPETIGEGDLLGSYLEQTLQDNPQLDSQDPMWKELLKEELMRFLETMLQLFQLMEERHHREKGFILAFLGGNMDSKRQMWQQAKQIIILGYKQEKVNINGYEEQLKETDNSERQEAILNALANDWDKACDEKLKQQEQAAIDQYGKNWECMLKSTACQTTRNISALRRLSILILHWQRLCASWDVSCQSAKMRWTRPSKNIFLYCHHGPNQPWR